MKRTDTLEEALTNAGTENNAEMPDAADIVTAEETAAESPGTEGAAVESPRTEDLSPEEPSPAPEEAPQEMSERDRSREQTRGFLYLAAGGYLLYTAWQIMNGVREKLAAGEPNAYGFLAAVIFFVIAGIGVIYMGVKKLKK